MDHDEIITCWLCGDSGSLGTMVSCGAATCGLTTPNPDEDNYMEGMKYFLICTNFENRTEFAGFWADDEDHALEQLDLCCDEYNPSQYVTHVFVSDTEIANNEVNKPLPSFITNLKVGDEIQWNDDGNEGDDAGLYKITAILTPTGNITSRDDVLCIYDGTVTAQIFAHEAR